MTLRTCAQKKLSIGSLNGEIHTEAFEENVEYWEHWLLIGFSAYQVLDGRNQTMRFYKWEGDDWDLDRRNQAGTSIIF